MVNHAETLLLNMTRTQLSEAGFRDGEPWLVDPSFSAVRNIPSGTSGVLDALFDGASTPEERARRAMDAVSVSLTGDMSRFFDALDPRRTIVYGLPRTIAGLHSSRKSGIPFETGVVKAAAVASGMFSPTGIRALDELVPDLRGILLGSHEAATRFSAAAALLAYRLEAARRTGSDA